MSFMCIDRRCHFFFVVFAYLFQNVSLLTIIVYLTVYLTMSIKLCT
jgi:hypothetical protein